MSKLKNYCKICQDESKPTKAFGELYCSICVKNFAEKIVGEILIGDFGILKSHMEPFRLSNISNTPGF